MTRLFYWLFSPMLDLIAPPRCAACSGIYLKEKQSAFCPKCLSTCVPIPAQDESSWALFAYQGAVKDAVHRMKYQRDDQAASALGAMLGAHLPQALASFDWVAPVPVGAKRLRERGFDQAAVIASRVASGLGVSFQPTLLRRRKETSALAKMEREDRAKAIEGAFEASSKAAGKKILLVDDVVTTGATTNEAKQALFASGATEVLVVSFAKTLLRADQSVA